ncbi:MAG: cyclase family protein [Acidimicrobiales bacterium]
MASVVVDLSHPFGHGTITYPGLPAPSIADHLSREESRDRYAPGVEFQIGRIDMVANTGTYLDTPFHRYADGHDLSGLDLSRVVDVPGVVVDGVEHGDLDVAGRAVLFHTGWDEHWGSDAYGDPSHPFLSTETVHRLIDGGASVVGIDSVNIDSTATGDRPVHSALLAAGIPIVEHLTNLGALLGQTFRFTAAPPAVVGMGTFPVRAVAVVG